MAKGKNFSCNNVGNKRKKSDLYETPYALTELLLKNVTIQFPGPILEPACGNGAITKVLKEFCYEVVEYDQETNFFNETRHFHTIVTNPPYSLSYEFIQKAKTVCDEFFFLLPLSYLHGKKRFDDIYQDKNFPLRKIWVFTRYPMLGDPLREDKLFRTGMMVYCFYHWDKSYGGEPTIGWLDNNEFVIRGK
jgi:hypothetical protein